MILSLTFLIWSSSCILSSEVKTGTSLTGDIGSSLGMPPLDVFSSPFFNNDLSLAHSKSCTRLPGTSGLKEILYRNCKCMYSVEQIKGY